MAGCFGTIGWMTIQCIIHGIGISVHMGKDSEAMSEF